MRQWRGETSFTIRHPWVVAFAFGLLHGFGFASGLTTMGLPQAEIPLALLLFNVGVEIGQVVLRRADRAARARVPHARDPLAARWSRRCPAMPSASLGAYWTIQRTLVLLGSAAMTGGRPAPWSRRWRSLRSLLATPLLAHDPQGQAAGLPDRVRCIPSRAWITCWR